MIQCSELKLITQQFAPLFCCPRAPLEEMTSFGLFLLLDKRFRQRAGRVRAYFAKHHRVDQGYRLRQGDILIVLTKLRTVLPD